MLFMDDLIFSQKFGDKIAIEDKDETITYEQLKIFCEKVASYLLSKGIQRGDHVCILLEKSWQYIAYCVSIMKVGAVFIPLDVDLPTSRINKIFDICFPKMIITNAYYRNKIENRESIIQLDANELSNTSNINRDIEDIQRSVNDVAYIIFTSGSTGDPKGVMIQHKSILSFLKNASTILGYNVSTRMLNIAPLFFDTSIHEIYCTLYCGGTVVIQKNILSIASVMKTIKQYSITDLIVVSTILKLMAAYLKSNINKDYRNLRTIIYCGETCPLSVVKTIKQELTRCLLIQGYGPTETTVGCMFNKNLDLNKVSEYGYLPLGRPLEGVHLYIINRENKLAKYGEIGELYIGGKQLMKGYCGNRELTEQVFQQFDCAEQMPIYKTGDLMFQDKNGEYFFVGRSDSMVKINGKPVFISEVENRLNACSEILEAYVLLYQDAQDMSKLAAVVVSKADSFISVDALKRVLKKELPEFMIPFQIKFIDEDQILRTPTGKVDKKSMIKYFTK